MTTEHDYQPPGHKEATEYFVDQPSSPQLIARTNSIVQPFVSLRREFVCIEDPVIIANWTGAVRQGLLDVVSGGTTKIEWNSFLPLRIHGEPHSWSDEKPEAGNFLLVAVAPGSTSWRQGIHTALACRRVLAEHGIADMHVVVAEMCVVAPVASRQASPHAEEAAEPPAPPPAVPAQFFDLKFFASKFLVGTSPPQQINEALLPFLPLPGQSLQSVQPGAGDRPSGSLGCFLQLEDEQGNVVHPRLALTSRHVALQDLYDHNRVYNISTRGAESPVVQISWGSNMVFERLLDAVKPVRDELSTNIAMYKRRIFGSGEPPEWQIEYLQLLEECHASYCETINSSLASLSDGSPGLPERHVGHVAFAGRHGLNKNGSWSDWALIALDKAKDQDTTSTDNPLYFGNHVYVAGFYPKCHARVASRYPQTRPPLDLDNDGFVQLKPLHPSLQTASNATPRFVMKQGPRTGITAGMLSPIEAVIRKPLPGVNVVALAWPVLSVPSQDKIALGEYAFSEAGDSGSCVFDGSGHIVGIIDAGLGKDENVSEIRLFKHRDSAVPTVLDNEANNDASVPPGFMSWSTKTTGGATTRVDISLTTPIDWVLSEVQYVTGLVPRIV